MISRRRFITISAAAALGSPANAETFRWRGTALGADITIELLGPRLNAQYAMRLALDDIQAIEGLFSLYNRNSHLVDLNKTGHLSKPKPLMLTLFQRAAEIHRITAGLFDPTVQAIWKAHALGVNPETAYPLVDWDRVQFDKNRIRRGPGQSLTFNGIAQGFATDLVTERLRTAGLTDVFVNIGEQATQGLPRRLGLVDPTHGLMGAVTIQDAAIATSSPSSTQIGPSGHIFSPIGAAPRWSTISVVAKNATLADGLSTALCLARQSEIETIARRPDVERILAVTHDGDLITLS